MTTASRHARNQRRHNRAAVRPARRRLLLESLEDRSLLAQLTFGTPLSLGSGVNTAGYESSPTTTADGLSLLFRHNQYPDATEILEATRSSTSAPFGNVVSAGAAVNAAGFPANAEVSDDGLTLLFSKDEDSNSGSLYQATRANRSQPFGSVTSLGDLLPGQPKESPSLSADGLTLYFTAWDSTTHVQNDIYQATRPTVSEAWGNVVMLSSAINVPGYNENNASISTDGLMLFFNSNRPGGFGNSDLYVATRPSLQSPWEPAINLGSQVNTAYDDKGPSVSADGSLLYFHSNRPGGAGAEDLYHVTVGYDAAPAPWISISDATAIEGSSALKILDRFVEANSGGLARPRTPLFGPDANGDGAQDLYVVSADTDKILLYDGKTGAFLRTFVDDGGRLINPGDIAFGPDGNLYVSSIGWPTGTPVIAGVGKVLRYDGRTGAYLDTIMTGLSYPLGVTVDSDGTVYAASQDSDEVFRRTSNGVTSVFISAGRGGLDQPRNILIGPDITGDGHADLYVSSQSYDGVLRYNGQTGAFIDRFATTGLGTGPSWIEIAPNGTLVATAFTTTTCCNISYVRFNGTTGAKIDQLDTTTLSWAFKFGPDGLIYGSYMTGGLQSYVDRVGPSSLLAFTVNLSAPSNVPVTVDYATANGSAIGSSDYIALSGKITFAPGETSRTILIQTVNDTAIELNETFSVNLSGAVGGVIVDDTGVGTIIDDDTKFYVVNDGSTAAADKTFEYGTGGPPITNAGENYNLASVNTAPRGAASTTSGDKVWVVDANKNVYVYGPTGNLLGSWAAGSIVGSPDVQGIATNGTDIWIVDAKSDKVYRYAGAASRLSGSQNAASSFALNSANKDASDLVTDGTSIWVVNNTTTTDKVFKYNVSGTLQGSWTISGGGGNPTGLTIDPAAVSGSIWIVDSNTDRIYQFTDGRATTPAFTTPATSFPLAAGNTNPQGIADPPASLPLPLGEGRGEGAAASHSALCTPHSAILHDTALLSLTQELSTLLASAKKRK